MLISSMIATLTLGIGSGVMVVAAQLVILIIEGICISDSSAAWLQFTLSMDIWWTTSVTFLFLSLIAVIAMAILIHGLEGALKRSRENEQRWHFALEGAGDGVWDWDLVREELYYSPGWLRMLGYGAEGPVSEHIDEVMARIHPEEKDVVTRSIESCLSGEKDSFKQRYRIRCHNGSYKWVLGRGKVVERDAEGRPLRLIGTMADITVLKQFEDQQIAYEKRLQSAEKMEAIGTLAGGVAHDFNNILTPIMGYTELLLNEGPDQTFNREHLNQIYSAAVRAKALVQQILSFSRQDKVETRPVEVELIVKEALCLLRATIPATIEIKQDIEGNCGIIDADPTQVHQVVMNLATNAWHAMEDRGGKMSISLRGHRVMESDPMTADVAPGEYVVLSVADTGTGIPPEVLNKIFNPFFTTKEKDKGTGMGLSQVHGIIQQMGGAIDVDTIPGQGSTFRVYIPVSKTKRAQSLERPDNIVGGGEHILLVDDELQIVEMRIHQLQELGYKVSGHQDSTRALEAFRENPQQYDLIITDLAMPQFSGEQLVAAIREISLDVPVLMCTGLSGRITEQRCRALQIGALILKPVAFGELAGKIRSLLDGA